MEVEFLALLERVTPKPRLIEFASAMFKDAWTQRAAQAASIARSYQSEADKIEKQIEALLDRVVEARRRRS